MEEKIYDFCPKCGALTLNGVCSSCGNRGRVKRMGHSEENVTSHSHAAADDIWQNQHSSKGIKKRVVSTGKQGKKLAVYIILIFFVGFGVPLLFSFVRATMTTNNAISQFLEDQNEDTTDFEEEDIPAENGDGETATEDTLDSVFDSTHKNHFGETFEGDYYTQFVDCIDESAGYDVEREEYTYKDVANSIDVIVSYVQIENDENGRDMSEINEFLKEDATYYMNALEEDSEETAELYADCTIRCDTYVTYNDEDKVSIVVYTVTDIGGLYSSVNMHAYTFDLAVGKIAFSCDMLDYNEEFIDEWTALSEKQNGKTAAEGVEFTKQELSEFFNGTNCIAFYTPMGMEVGYSYYDYDTGISGWITVTLKDYEKYLKKM